MEALLLAANVFCMAWLCWKIFKVDENASRPDLGIFSYRHSAERKDAEAP